jgi:hypothetical protein
MPTILVDFVGQQLPLVLPEAHHLDLHTEEELLDLKMRSTLPPVFLAALQQPLNVDTANRRIIGLRNLNIFSLTLYFSVLTSLTMSTLVSSESMGANRMRRSVIICL